MPSSFAPSAESGQSANSFVTPRRAASPWYVHGAQSRVASSHFNRSGISLGVAPKELLNRLGPGDSLKSFSTPMKNSEQAEERSIEDAIGSNPFLNFYSNEPSAVHQRKSRAIIDDLHSYCLQDRTAGDLLSKISQIEKQTAEGQRYGNTDDVQLKAISTPAASDLLREGEIIDLADKRKTYSIAVSRMLNRDTPSLGFCPTAEGVAVLSNRDPVQLSHPRNKGPLVELAFIHCQAR